MPNTPTATLSANVRAELSRAGLRQGAIAECLGLAPASVSARMRGQIEFTVTELVAVARLLDVPLERLLEGVEDVSVTTKAAS